MLCVASCAEPKTMIVARIESDLMRCDELTHVHLRAQWENGAVFAEASDSTAPRDVCDGGLRFPGEIGVVPRDPADPRRVILQVTGTVQSGGSSYTLRQEFVTRFQQGRTVYVSFSLARVCASSPCPSGYSCVPGPSGEARCASREEPVVFTPEQAAGRDATVWGDALAADAVPSGDVLADLATEKAGADAPGVDAAEASDVLEEMAALLDGNDGAEADRSEDAGIGEAPPDADGTDAVDEASTAVDASLMDDTEVFDSTLSDDRADVADIGSDTLAIDGLVDAATDSDATSDGPASDRHSETDAMVVTRCTPGTVLLGSRPIPLSPWSASYVGSTTPRFRWRMGLGTPAFPVCIEVCQDRACTMVEDTIEAPAGTMGVVSAAMPNRPLRSGVHFWRMTSFNTDFFPAQWSPFGPTWEFVVVNNSTARTPEQTPMWGVVPDFNGDGLADGIFPETAASGGIAVVLAASGRGLEVSAATTMPRDPPIATPSVGDINGDGFVDLVFSRGGLSGESSLSVSYYAGGPTGLARSVSGAFGSSSPYECNRGAARCRCRFLGDVDDNGGGDFICLDLQTRTDEYGTFVVSGGTIASVGPSGGVTRSGPFGASGPVGGIVPSMIAGNFDANSDGISDFIVSGDAVRSVIVLGRNFYDIRPVTMSAILSPSAGISYRISARGDFNGDGFVDLLGTGSAPFVILGPLLAASPIVVPIRAPVSIYNDLFPVETQADVNGDGITDILGGEANYSAVVRGGGRVRVLLGRPSGSAPTFLDVAATSTLTYCRGLEDFGLGSSVIPLGDTDGDGVGDFFASAQGTISREMIYFRGSRDFLSDSQMPVVFPRR